VEAGHDVVCVNRGQREPYRSHEAWKQIGRVVLDRSVAESEGTFGRRIAELVPDVVIDLTCYTLESARCLVDALRGRVQHFLHCGTIWVHGHSVQVPTMESAPRQPFGDYGCRKAAIEAYLQGEAHDAGFPVTVLHPGHLVGPGWFPINPAGNFNPEVFSSLAAGDEVLLPNLGMEMVHHVHADDVAQSFVLAVARRDEALGESFHVVSSAALTLRGFAESVASWFGREARLRFLPWEEWRRSFSEKDAWITWDHIAHSPNCSIEKARSVLGYRPSYSSLEAVLEAVTWLTEKGQIVSLLPGAPGKDRPKE
jgi:nucleoside-diphosphate-sugar epimerase